jgi:hypothetical protein
MYLVAKGLKFKFSSPKLDLIFYNFFYNNSSSFNLHRATCVMIQVHQQLVFATASTGHCKIYKASLTIILIWELHHHLTND